jgi:hypothetical protein
MSDDFNEAPERERVEVESRDYYRKHGVMSAPMLERGDIVVMTMIMSDEGTAGSTVTIKKEMLPFMRDTDKEAVGLDIVDTILMQHAKDVRRWTRKVAAKQQQGDRNEAMRLPREGL